MLSVCVCTDNVKCTSLVDHGNKFECLTWKDQQRDLEKRQPVMSQLLPTWNNLSEPIKVDLKFTHSFFLN